MFWFQTCATHNKATIALKPIGSIIQRIIAQAYHPSHANELPAYSRARRAAAGRGVTIVPRDAVRNGPWRERLREAHPNGKRASNALYLLNVGSASADVAAVAAIPEQ